MLSLIEHNLALLGVALLIGFASGWWMRRPQRRGGTSDKGEP